VGMGVAADGSGDGELEVVFVVGGGDIVGVGPGSDVGVGVGAVVPDGGAGETTGLGVGVVTSAATCVATRAAKASGDISGGIGRPPLPFVPWGTGPGAEGTGTTPVR
jgi:hypothetical protein